MFVDILLAIAFLTSAFAFWYRLSLKIPELVAVPDHVITEHLEEDSAGLRLFLLRLKIYYREGRHKQVFWSFLGKVFYRLHVLLMRTDNGTVALLKKIRMRGGAANGNGNGAHTAAGDQDYWQKLQEPKETTSSSRSRLIEEVRKRE